MAATATKLNFHTATRGEPISAASFDLAAPSPGLRLRFGSFELDPKSGELTGADGTVVLQRQPLQLLLMLIEHSGEMVTRGEIQKRLWSDDVIVDFDLSINQLARKLRRVLGDSAVAPNYIETLARRGYRLKVAVETIEKPKTGPAAINVARVVLNTPPAVWHRHDQSEPAASGRNSWLRLREVAGATEQSHAPRHFSRCRQRVSQNAKEHHDSLAPLMRMVTPHSLCEYLTSASPAEKLDALRQLLVMVTQILEDAPL
jgi:DNA-binding winged helix-turn-helix (wHTH) protein